MSAPGDILVGHVSRRFRVYPRPCGRSGARAETRAHGGRGRLGAAGRVRAGAARPGGRHRRAQRLRVVDAAPPDRRDHQTDGRARRGQRPRGLAPRARRGFPARVHRRENVYLNGAILGLKRSHIHEQLDEIVAFGELERFIDLPVRTYSSGMYMRLDFAIAAHLDADVLLLDEVFAVGDEGFQRKCFWKIREFKQRGGTIVFVSHDTAAVERLCERAVLLREGVVDYDGSTRGARARYHQQLAEARDPAEREAGLREWGSGEVRIVEAALPRARR